VNTARFQCLGAPHIVFEVGIAAIDDDVIPLKEGGQRLHRLLCWVAGGDHDPGGARPGQPLHEILKRRGADGPLAGQMFDVLRVEVVHHALMPGVHQTSRHVGTHSAETDHAKLHGLRSFSS
jgi:hypothetical protein